MTTERGDVLLADAPSLPGISYGGQFIPFGALTIGPDEEDDFGRLVASLIAIARRQGSAVAGEATPAREQVWVVRDSAGQVSETISKEDVATIVYSGTSRRGGDAWRVRKVVERDEQGRVSAIVEEPE